MGISMDEKIKEIEEGKDETFWESEYFEDDFVFMYIKKDNKIIKTSYYYDHEEILKPIHININKEVVILNDSVMELLDLCNFRINLNKYVYDGFINHAIFHDAAIIMNDEKENIIIFNAKYLYNKIKEKKINLNFNKTQDLKIINKNDYNYNFILGLDDYKQEILVSLKDKGKIFKTLPTLKTKDTEYLQYIFKGNDMPIDIFPIYFKNEALFLIKDNNYLFDEFIRNISRQENNFIVYLKDLNYINKNFEEIMKILSFFNYFDEKTCYLQENTKSSDFNGSLFLENYQKGIFDFLSDEIEKLEKIINTRKFYNYISKIIIPTEKYNETIFGNNVKIIKEDIFLLLFNNDILKNIRNEILKTGEKEKESEKKKQQNKSVSVSEFIKVHDILVPKNKGFSVGDQVHKLITTIINFRNMYSHDLGCYYESYKKNYDKIDIGKNYYRLKKNPKDNDYNHMSKQLVKNLTIFLELYIQLIKCYDNKYILNLT